MGPDICKAFPLVAQIETHFMPGVGKGLRFGRYGQVKTSSSLRSVSRSLWHYPVHKPLDPQARSLNP